MTLLSKYQQLNRIGLRNMEQIHYQPKLKDMITSTGVALTPQDRYIVRESMTNWHLDNPIDPAYFGWIYQEMEHYFKHRCVYVQDGTIRDAVGKQLNVRVISETPWHDTCFEQVQDSVSFTPDFMVIYAANFKAKPQLDGTRSEAFSLTHLTKRLILIGGTPYHHEVAHAMTTVMTLL
ncbi:MAG: hypothetical protein Kow00117_02150 [Phototrophicales bacterium]